VVLIVFDAFRVTLLEDANGAIDSSRFPNLAALVGEATWYRNATTAHENTVFSVPAILDGRTPRVGTQPTLASHPQNLFTLLAGDHRMNVHEEATQLCAPSLCGPHGSTSIIQRLSHGRVQRFSAALRGIHGGGKPGLTFVHAFFPHEPRQYLPDGRSYQPGADIEPALDGPPSFTNAWLTRQSLQRTLLQMMFSDRLVGRLVKRLKDSGQWTRTLLIITADHGESFAVKRTPAEPFEAGHLHWRRAVTPANIEEIAPVPLFVKYPDQQLGSSDERFVRTLDVLPTIADVTGHPARWDVAGRSLRDDAYKGNATVAVGKSGGGAVSLPAQTWVQRTLAAQRSVLALFPAGQGLAGLYGIGPRPDLNGRALSELRVLPRGRVRATLTEPDRWRSVHLHSWLLPLHVTGRISPGKPNGRPLAVAVNGRVAATAWSFRPLGAKRLSISALIPEAALRSGRNDVRVYEIVGQGSLRRLG
jgi:hypothetical protein